MRTSVRYGIKFFLVIGVMIGVWSRQSCAATKIVGDLADRFMVQDFLNSGGTIDLYDYAGKILVVDFWAHWCGPCKSSTPLVEANVRQYYLDQGGNAAGIPVEVISISIDNSDLSLVQGFINTYHPHVVGIANGQAWNQFSLGYIPHFAVINCSAGSNSHAQWEILYSNSGYNEDAIKAAIDSVTVFQTPYELWKHSMFTTVQLSDTNVCGYLCDPDGDGLPNLLEYAHALDPTQHDGSMRFGGGFRLGEFTMTYRENKDATDLVFTPESAGALAVLGWSSSGIVEVGREDSNTFWSVTVKNNGLGNAGFMRLKVQKP